MKVPVEVDISLLPEGMSAEEFLALYVSLPSEKAMGIEFTEADVKYVLANQPKPKLTKKEQMQQLEIDVAVKDATIAKLRIENKERESINEFLHDQIQKERDWKKTAVLESNGTKALLKESMRDIRHLQEVHDSLEGEFRRVDGYRILGLLESVMRHTAEIQELKLKLSWMTSLVNEAVGIMMGDKFFKSLFRREWSAKINRILTHKFK